MTLWLQFEASLDTASSRDLQSSRYLPPTTIRVLLDEHGRRHDNELAHAAIGRHRITVSADTAVKIVQARQQPLRELLSRCEELAHAQAPELLAAAHQQSKNTLRREIERLQALRLVNPNVRDEEIDYFEGQLESVTRIIDAASLRLDACRIIVTT